MSRQIGGEKKKRYLWDRKEAVKKRLRNKETGQFERMKEGSIL